LRDDWDIQTPHFGNTVTPAAETAQGTSSVQGMAALTTTQSIWICAFKMEHESQSGRHPKQQNGVNGGAPGLQQHSQLQQQTPACSKMIWFETQIKKKRKQWGIMRFLFCDVFVAQNIEQSQSCHFSMLGTSKHQATSKEPPRKKDEVRFYDFNFRTLPLQPKQPQVGSTEQLTQQSAQQRIKLSSLMLSLSPQQHMMFLWQQKLCTNSNFAQHPQAEPGISVVAKSFETTHSDHWRMTHHIVSGNENYESEILPSCFVFGRKKNVAYSNYQKWATKILSQVITGQLSLIVSVTRSVVVVRIITVTSLSDGLTMMCIRMRRWWRQFVHDYTRHDQNKSEIEHEIRIDPFQYYGKSYRP
jgi:hypothetical protein